MIRSHLNYKLFFLAKIFLIYLIISVKSYASDTKTQDAFIVMGTYDAPVKIKIFSSLTCQHWADFHIKVLPEINKNYVEKGKVQLIFIDFPLDLAAFNASKILHCLDQEKQIPFLDTIYENQQQWASGSNIDEINDNLKEMVNILGISSKQFNKCQNDEVVGDKILNGRINGQQKYSINSTPTIIINEKKLEGSVNFKNIEKKIEKLI